MKVLNLENKDDNNIINYCNSKGECSNCGECCTDTLPLSTDEIVKIRNYVNKHKIKEQRHITSNIDMTCPFRDNLNKKCLIYKVRPLICRNFKCDKDLKSVIKFRNEVCRKRPNTSLRKVIYNNDEVSDFVSYMKRVISK